jgi:hypothetical protein
MAPVRAFSFCPTLRLIPFCSALLSLTFPSHYTLPKIPRDMLSQTPAVPIVFPEHYIHKNMNPNASVENIDLEILEAACILVNISQGIHIPKTHTDFVTHLPISTPSSSYKHHLNRNTIHHLEEQAIAFSLSEQVSGTPTNIDGSTVSRWRPQQSFWSLPSRS